MSKKKNPHPFTTGTEHGYLECVSVNTESNEIDACIGERYQEHSNKEMHGHPTRVINARELSARNRREES